MDLFTLVATLALNSTGYITGLRNAKKEAKLFGDDSEASLSKSQKAGAALVQTGDKISGIGKKLTPVSLAVGALGGIAIKTTADFDSQMSKVSAISGATGDDFDSLRDKAREMGAETKFSATEAGEAMEYMAMAGWKTDDMLEGIEGIMNLAAASGEDLASTSDIVTDALTAFGMSADESAHFADVLAAASTNANTNVAMLGESFRYVAPVAGAMGYSAEDVSAALGLMANSGVKASMAGTSLRTLMTNMANPTKKMQQAMDDLGVSLTDDEGNMKSFRDIMEDLRTGFGNLKQLTSEQQAEVDKLGDAWANGTITEDEYAAAIDKLLGGIDDTSGAMQAQTAAMLAGKTGMSGLLAIVNSSDEDFDKLIGAIDDSDGAAEDMAETMQDNLGGQLTILKSQLQELAISFGDILTPAIRKIVSGIQKLVDWFNNLSPTAKKIIAIIGTVVAVAGPLLIVIGTLISALGNIIIMAPAITAAITMMEAPLLPIIAIILGIVAAIIAVIAIIKNWEKITAKFSEVWENLKAVVVAVWAQMKDAITTAVAVIKRVVTVGFNAVKTVIVTPFRVAATVIRTVFNTIKTVITTTVNAIKRVFETVKEALTKPFKAAWDIIKGIIDKLKNAFNFHWSLPSLKLPHISVKGGEAPFGIGGKGSLPKFSISWYKKAEENPYLFTDATLFGAGEAGDEMLYGRKALMDDIKEATSGGGVHITNYFTINNADRPEEVANTVVRHLKMQMRMA